MRLAVALLSLAVGMLACAAASQTLRIAVSVETTSIDPHFHSTTPNAQIARHIFDPLVALDERQQIQPGLAMSWRMVEPTRWVIALRPGVAFHDGQPFGAEDVVVSLRRAVAVEGSPGGYGSYLRAISAVTALDPLTVEIRTAVPHPSLPWDLTAVGIVPRAADGARTDAFNSGKLAIGTGPFRFAGWRKGEVLELDGNGRWWGGAVPWRNVVVRPIANDAARVASLVSGDVDLIEAVPTPLLADLGRRPGIHLAQAVTSRVIFIGLDSAREPTPFVTDAQGRPLAPNPLRDPRVRRAISLAIDRQAIADRIMEGAAVPAAQLLPEGYVGTSRRLAPDRYDPDGARRLLAAAGHPGGFTITLHGPTNRYPNDEKVLVAVAGMLQRVGITVRAVNLSTTVFKSRAAKREFSAFLDGWSTETGDSGLALRALLATADPKTGWGGFNRSGYSNRAFDDALAVALTAIDDGARADGLARAIEVAMDDAAMLPLYFQRAAWATGKGVVYAPRADEYTLAISARPAR